MKRLKAAIADEILSPEIVNNVTRLDRTLGSVGQPIEILSVEYMRLSNYSGQLRVKTDRDGTHYFEIRISEQR